MKTKILSALIGLGCFIQPLFAQDAATNAAPVIPEAAREHFVMGTTLYSNATSVVDFKQAADEFQQAADLAPQWSKPRYNLAWAKEAAEDYAGAIADLKRYQQFALPEAEARAVQDKIYVIKAKLAKAEKKKGEEKKVVDTEKAEKAKREEYLNSLVGYWKTVGSGNGYDKPNQCLRIERLPNGKWKATDEMNANGHWNYNELQDVKIEGDLLQMKYVYNDGSKNDIFLSIDNQGNLSGEVHVGMTGFPPFTSKRSYVRSQSP